MRCSKTRQKLDAYLSGEVGERERARIERHLASCTECREALEHARQLHTVLGRKGTPPLPEGFHDRLMGRAEEHMHNRGSVHKILWLFGGSPTVSAGVRAAAAAGVVVALAVGILIGQEMWRARGEPQEGPAQLATADPVEVYRADYLAEIPRSSLAGAYVSLASAKEGD